MKAYLKKLTAVENMRRSQEKCVVQQQVTAIQRRVLEVTQQLQSVQDKAYALFEELEGQGSQLE
jgi:uncharacterized protein YhaN